MGVYLSTPKTEKTSADGEDDRLRFGVSSMQGWRSTMEDDVSLRWHPYSPRYMFLNQMCVSVLPFDVCCFVGLLSHYQKKWFQVHAIILFIKLVFIK